MQMSINNNNTLQYQLITVIVSYIVLQEADGILESSTIYDTTHNDIMLS